MGMGEMAPGSRGGRPTQGVSGFVKGIGCPGSITNVLGKLVKGADSFHASSRGRRQERGLISSRC